MSRIHLSATFHVHMSRIHLIATFHVHISRIHPIAIALQTVKYNMKKRAGRGFTLEELKVRLAACWNLFPRAAVWGSFGLLLSRARGALPRYMRCRVHIRARRLPPGAAVRPAERLCTAAAPNSTAAGCGKQRSWGSTLAAHAAGCQRQQLGLQRVLASTVGAHWGIAARLGCHEMVGGSLAALVVVCGPRTQRGKAGSPAGQQPASTHMRCHTGRATHISVTAPLSCAVSLHPQAAGTPSKLLQHPFLWPSLC